LGAAVSKDGHGHGRTCGGHPSRRALAALLSMRSELFHCLYRQHRRSNRKTPASASLQCLNDLVDIVAHHVGIRCGRARRDRESVGK
jgi:hypothetical protein